MKEVFLYFGGTTLIVLAVIMLAAKSKKHSYEKKHGKQSIFDMGEKSRHYFGYYICTLIGFGIVILYLQIIRYCPELNSNFFFASGLVFFAVTLAAGLAIEGFYYLYKTKYLKMSKSQSVLTPEDKKRLGILALAVSSGILFVVGDIVSCGMCIVLILSYFTWIIIIPNEFKKNWQALFKTDLETFFTTFLLLVITFSYLVIIYMIPVKFQIPCIAGLIAGITIAILYILYKAAKKYKREEDKKREKQLRKEKTKSKRKKKNRNRRKK